MVRMHIHGRYQDAIYHALVNYAEIFYDLRYKPNPKLRHKQKMAALVGGLCMGNHWTKILTRRNSTKNGDIIL